MIALLLLSSRTVVHDKFMKKLHPIWILFIGVMGLSLFNALSPRGGLFLGDKNSSEFRAEQLTQTAFAIKAQDPTHSEESVALLKEALMLRENELGKNHFFALGKHITEEQRAFLNEKDVNIMDEDLTIIIGTTPVPCGEKLLIC